jgi:hypothetical protein
LAPLSTRKPTDRLRPVGPVTTASMNIRPMGSTS